MKKCLILFISILGLFLAVNVEAKVKLPEKTDHEKVNVYLFWSSTCSNCHNLIKYFANKYQYYSDYFEIVAYQVNNNSTNEMLASEIAEEVGKDPGYVPLVVIGDSYAVLGWDDSVGTTIIEEALKAYEDDEYTDIVLKRIDEKKLDVTKMMFSEVCKAIGVSYNVKDDSKVNAKFVVCFVSLVALMGISGLVFISKKDKNKTDMK